MKRSATTANSIASMTIRIRDGFAESKMVLKIQICVEQARRQKKFQGGHSRFRGGTPLIFCRTQGSAAKLQRNFPNFGGGHVPPKPPPLSTGLVSKICRTNASKIVSLFY